MPSSASPPHPDPPRPILVRLVGVGTIGLAVVTVAIATTAWSASAPGAALALLLAGITVAAVAWSAFARARDRAALASGRPGASAETERLELAAMRAAFDHDTIVLALDRSRRVTFANRAAGRLFDGAPDPAALRGRAIGDLLPAIDEPDDGDASAIRTLVAGGTWRRDLPVAATTEATPDRRIDTTVRAIRRTTDGGRSRVEGFIVVASDVSERRRSEIERHALADRLERTARHVPGVIYEYLLRPDGSSCFPWSSDGIRAIYGVAPADVRADATAVFDVLHPDDFDHVAETIERSARTLEPWRCEYRVVLPGRGERWLLGHSAPQRLPDGSTLWHGCITDITAQKRTEAALEARASELAAASERSRALATALDATDDPVLLIDADGDVVHGNPAYRRLVASLVDGDTRATPVLDALRAGPHASREAAAALRAGGAWSGVVRLDDATGGERSLDLSLTPLVHADGSSGFVVVHRDVTERERAVARERLERLRARLLSGVVDRLAGDGPIESRVHAALDALLDAEVLGRPTGARLAADLDAASAEPRTRSAGDDAADDDSLLAAPISSHDGEIGTLVITGGRTDDDARATLAEIARSIAPILDRARLESALDAARRRAEAANEGKTGLLTTLSHELRTPLSAILGYTELLRSEDASRHDQPHVLGVIDNAGRHMLALLNQILDLSRIEAGRLTVEDGPTDLPGVVTEAAEMLRSRARTEDVELRIETAGPVPRTIRSDSVRLRQIVVNLVGNAIKFSHGGRVTVRVGVEDRPGDAADGADAGRVVAIDVEDTGIGISPGDADRLFRPFVQADAAIERTFGGSGLGLSISRGIARVMRGDVRLTSSTPGEGSTFRVEIPLRPEPDTEWIDAIALDRDAPVPIDDAVARHRPEDVPADRRGTGHGVDDAPMRDVRVLVVDDGPDNRRLIAHHLRRAGAEVIEASDGELGLEAFRAAADAGEPFDLVVTDMMMPTLDGYALARALRAESTAVPILALTANATAEDRDRCLSAGCDAHLAKPFTRDDLIDACARASTSIRDAA